MTKPTLREKLKPLIDEMIFSSDLPDTEVSREVIHAFLSSATLFPEEAEAATIASYIRHRQSVWPEQWEGVHIDPDKVAHDIFEVWSRSRAA